MRLLATALHASSAFLLFTMTPASGSPSAGGGPAEDGRGDASGVRDGAARTREPSFNDCRGANTYTFNTALPDTRCAGPGLVIFADSEVEALGCAAATAALQGVQLAPAGAARTYAICVTSPFGRSTQHVVTYSQDDAKTCARSYVCGALGNCTAAPNACP
ncbi:hypothetical protein WME79_23100 [Sorangium sp. So ce726]|uniref:hypothetical protein n=1 Tax=Sorangium sp. So ce726 TaxID=3133319 RepID=UPI003F5E1F7C